MGAASPVTFRTPAAFRAWLRAHHRTARALVVRIAKTHAAHTGITYPQALDEALCFGWIDGVRRRLDEERFSIRFSPRKAGSIWSRVNVQHAKRLIEAKRMTAAGLAAFQARRNDRTGIYAFEQRPKELPPALQRQFKAHPEAWRYFQAQAPWYRRTSGYWVVSAKREETRQKRLRILIDCSAAGVRIPSLRRP